MIATCVVAAAGFTAAAGLAACGAAATFDAGTELLLAVLALSASSVAPPTAVDIATTAATAVTAPPTTPRPSRRLLRVRPAPRGRRAFVVELIEILLLWLVIHPGRSSATRPAGRWVAPEGAGECSDSFPVGS